MSHRTLDMSVHDMDNSGINHQWVSDFNADMTHAIVSLVDCASGDGGTLGYAEPMSAAQAQAFMGNLCRRVASGESHVLLGRIGQVPVFLVVLTINGMTNCRHRAELSKGVVHPNFRGRNLVQVAFREVVRRSEQLSIEQLVLDVREGSRAHLLWRRFGFESFGVMPDYARVDGTSYNGHFMVQTVASLRTRVMAQPDRVSKEKDEVHG